MKLNKIIFIVAALFSISCYAYDLDGSMTPISDGVYAVELVSSYGRKFYGHAEDQGDGSFDVTVSDSTGKIFEGYALNNLEGGYVLNLESDATGEVATGTLEKR